jgi:hypothetical protein
LQTLRGAVQQSPREQAMAKQKEDEQREILPDEEDDFFLNGPIALDDDELLAGSEYNVRAAGRETVPITGGGNRHLGALEEEGGVEGASVEERSELADQELSERLRKLGIPRQQR